MGLRATLVSISTHVVDNIAATVSPRPTSVLRRLPRTAEGGLGRNLPNGMCRA